MTLNGYTESQIIPEYFKESQQQRHFLEKYRDNFLVIYTVSFPKSLA